MSMQGARFVQLIRMGPAFGVDWVKMRREQRLAAATAANDGDPDDSTALLPSALEPTGEDDRPSTYEDAVNRVWALIVELKESWIGTEYDLLHRCVDTMRLTDRPATATTSAMSSCIA